MGKVNHLADCQRSENATCGSTDPTSSSCSNRALASPCFPEIKTEQNAWSPMGMPRITKLGQLDPFIAVGNELMSLRLKISHLGMFMMRPREGP